MLQLPQLGVEVSLPDGEGKRKSIFFRSSSFLLVFPSVEQNSSSIVDVTNADVVPEVNLEDKGRGKGYSPSQRDREI